MYGVCPNRRTLGEGQSPVGDEKQMRKKERKKNLKAMKERKKEVQSVWYDK